MDLRILIIQPTVTRGSSGEQATTWTPLISTGDGKVWATPRFLSGVETLRAGEVIATTRGSFRIRHRTTVTEAMRFVADGVTYNIKAIQPDGQRVWMYLVGESIPA